jgi:septation ring formation regulator EzrA
MAGQRGRKFLVGLSVVLVVAIGVVVWLRQDNDGRDDDGRDDDAPSQQAFAERANEICREAERSLRSVGEGVQSLEEIVPAIDRVIEESRNAVDELGDLERPAGNAGERAQEFVDTTRAEIEEVGIPALEEFRAAVENRDQQAAQRAAQRLRQLDTRASNEAARQVGATACADEG